MSDSVGGDAGGDRVDVPALTRRVRAGDQAALTEALELLPALDPGPRTADLLMALPATADRCAMTIELHAWDRHLSWSQAQLYGAARPFALSDSPERGNLETVRHALGLSAHGAKNIVAVARRLFTLFASTLGLLQRGQISRGHVWALIETTADLDDHQAGRIEDLTIAEAPQQNIAEFRRALDRARLTVCPEAANERHDRKVAGRHVARWTGRDGMGRMLADLPPEDIAAAWQALCRRADDIAQPDDPRARAARLADALVESITGIPAANDPRRRPDTPTTCEPDDTWMTQPVPTDQTGLVSQPAGTPPADPVEPHDTEPAHQPAPEWPAPPQSVPEPPAPELSVPAEPPAPAHQPAPGPALDGGQVGDEVEIHVVVRASELTYRPDQPAQDQPAQNPPPPALPPANRATRRAQSRPAPSRPARSRRGRRLGSAIWAVIGWDSLFGQAQVPGEIHTFGAVPASVVRAMAQGRVILRRLVIDSNGRLLDAELTIATTPATTPATPLGPDLRELMLSAPYRQHPLDYGATVYRLPAELDRHIVLRDRTCTIPGCGRPAASCDGEHAVAWPRGSTSEANCGAMCRWHHRLKTHASWMVDRLSDGSVLWTSPEGHTRQRPAFDYTRYLS
jgi:hypothetical protein